MSQARTTLLGARSYAQHNNYHQLAHSLMQTMQPWGVVTDEPLLELDDEDAAVFEDFWRAFFADKKEKFLRRDSNGKLEKDEPLEHIKRWSLLVLAAVSAGNLCEQSKALANDKCGEIAKAIDKTLAAPTPKPAVENSVTILPVVRIEREPPLATKRPRFVGAKPTLVPTPSR